MINITQKIADLNQVLETEGVNTIYRTSTFIVPTIENGKGLCIWVCFICFFLFSTQNELPQMIIGLS